jgi:hypothetical protein
MVLLESVDSVVYKEKETESCTEIWRDRLSFPVTAEHAKLLFSLRTSYKHVQ